MCRINTPPRSHNRRRLYRHLRRCGLSLGQALAFACRYERKDTLFPYRGLSLGQLLSFNRRHDRKDNLYLLLEFR